MRKFAAISLAGIMAFGALPVMAEETRCKRELDECTADVAKYQSYAEKALKAGNEADARTFLEKKQQLVSKQATLQQTYNIAADNAAKMRQMHDKLCKDIQSLEARRDAVKAKVAAAKAQERINKVGSSVNSVGTSMDAFGKMEAKANKMLDEANAMAELNQTQLDAFILSKGQDEDGASPKAFKRIMIITGVICLLIAPENLSTAALLFGVVYLMMFIGRVPLG